MIREAIRKIALGRSMERINMSASGTEGIGTARMIHGYVAKIHDDESDPEFKAYGGTIDVGEFPDETASSTPVIHKGVLLAGAKDNSGGFLIIPSLFSDVTIVTDAGTKSAYVLSYTHADVLQLSAHSLTKIGVTETEELNPEDDHSPDYNELDPTGNASITEYTSTSIKTEVRNNKGELSTVLIEPQRISQVTDQAEFNQSREKIEHKVKSTSVVIADKKVTIGEESASEPLVLGNQLAQLMLEFLTECSKITTPTLMGTMPAINVPNFATLTSKIQKFLSKTAYTK